MENIASSSPNSNGKPAKYLSANNNLDADRERWELLQQVQDELLHVLKMGDVNQVKKYNSRYMQLLHEYNETKDAAILLLSKMAEMDQVPMSEVYSRYSANFD